MNDTQIFQALIRVLQPQLSKRFPTARMQQAAQQNAQGVPTEPTVVMRNIGDINAGWARKDHQFKAPPGTPPLAPMPTKTTQWLTSRIQFSGMLSNPVNDGLPTTAGDMMRFLALLLSTDVILAQLRANGLNPLRVTDVQKPLVTDDRDQFAIYPTFDLMVQHHDTLELEVPVIASVVPEIHAV